MGDSDIVYRLRKRAEIRRQIPNRKSVQEGKPDRIADLLEEAATDIELLRMQVESLKQYKLYKPDYIPSTYDSNKGCYVCGIGANGAIIGYVCNRSDCPTRITC